MSKITVDPIYIDDKILVINKPAGLSITKDHTRIADLAEMLTQKLTTTEAKQLQLVHRLDKDTSGVMVLAKGKDAQAEFAAYFEEGLAKMTYLAIVSGIAAIQQGQIKSFIAQHRKNTSIMRIHPSRGKEAITDWRLLADFGTVALLAVTPQTFRTHQIRVHLPSIAMPLTIDPAYGSRKPIFLSDFKHGYKLSKGQTEKPLMDRLTLHAYQIEFPELKNNAPSCFIAPLDKKFKAAIKMLTKHNPKAEDAFINTNNFSKIINAQKL